MLRQGCDSVEQKKYKVQSLSIDKLDVVCALNALLSEFMVADVGSTVPLQFRWAKDD
jgi:hypothetical protein